MQAQLAYLGSAGNPGGDTGQQDREGRATGNEYVINPATTVGNWISVSWRHSGKDVEHACQRYPTQWGKGAGAFILQLPTPIG